MGSARIITGSCTDDETTGWLTIDLPCRARRTPSWSSRSMAGSGNCTPDRVPLTTFPSAEPAVSTTLTE